MKRPRSRPADDAPRGRGRPPWHGAARLIYLSGVAHSAVFHTLLLLLLAAIVARDEPDRVVAIEMSFDQSSAVPPSAESVPSIAVIASAIIDGRSSPPAATPAGAPLPLPPESPPPPMVLEDFAATAAEVRPEDLPFATLDSIVAPDRLPVDRDRSESARAAATAAAVRAGLRTLGRSSPLPAMADEPPREFNVVAVSDVGPQRVTTFTVDG